MITSFQDSIDLLQYEKTFMFDSNFYLYKHKTNLRIMDNQDNIFVILTPSEIILNSNRKKTKALRTKLNKVLPCKIVLKDKKWHIKSPDNRLIKFYDNIQIKYDGTPKNVKIVIEDDKTSLIKRYLNYVKNECIHNIFDVVNKEYCTYLRSNKIFDRNCSFFEFKNKRYSVCCVCRIEYENKGKANKYNFHLINHLKEKTGIFEIILNSLAYCNKLYDTALIKQLKQLQRYRMDLIYRDKYESENTVDVFNKATVKTNEATTKNKEIAKLDKAIEIEMENLVTPIIDCVEKYLTDKLLIET